MIWVFLLSVALCLNKTPQELNQQIEKTKEMKEREKRKIIAEEKHKEWVQKKNEQVRRKTKASIYFAS